MTLEFKNETYITPEEARILIRDAGIPEIEMGEDTTGRNHTRFQYEKMGFHGLFLELYQLYGSTEEAEAFLDTYVARLEDEGYYYTNPERFGSYKPFLYFNEELKKYVAFDLIRGDSSAAVNLELVSIEPEDDMVQSILGK